MRFSRLSLVGVASCALVLAGCGSSGGGPAAHATAPANPAAAEAQVRQAYEGFFGGGASQAASYLQDATQLTKALRDAQKLLGSGKESAKILSVRFTSPTQASVTYRLSVNGNPVLKNATGQAVLVNGRWLVAKSTFCSLVSLGTGHTEPGCS